MREEPLEPRTWEPWRWAAFWSLPVFLPAWMLGLWIYYWRASARLGRPPHWDEDAGLAAGFHAFLIILGYPFALFLVPTWSVAMVIALFQCRRPGLVVVALASAWIVPLVVWKCDLSGVLDWFVDRHF